VSNPAVCGIIDAIVFGEIMAGKWIAAGLGALALAGCAVGTAPGEGALSGSFDAAVSLRQAYQAARQQADLCLLGEGGYEAVGNLDEAGGRGQLSVQGKLGPGEVAGVALSSIDATHTRVRVSMWGKNLWAEPAMRAMHDAIMFGAPSCTTYMPRVKDKDPNAWFTRR